MKRFLRMSYLAASIGGVMFFAMSVVLLGVWPGRTLDHDIHAMSPPHPMDLTASEQHGRTIYSREGCAYCHTEQIRYIESDTRRFGAATLAWETRFDYPHLWGTRRIGPDLSREGAVRSNDWQLTHLYQPREAVADSVMPAYAWLFDGAPDRPKQDALDVLAYLETLGRNRALAGAEGDAHALAACNCSDDEKRFGFSQPLNANPAMAQRGSAPVLTISNDLPRGRAIYSSNCASCHEASAPGLRPKPANLAAHQYTLAALSDALWNGRAGTSMPAWRDLPLADLSAVAAAVREKSPPQADSVADELGERVYRNNCAHCHGERGAGDGSAASQFTIAPVNFVQQRARLEYAQNAIKNGIDGSPMAAWTTRLTDEEIAAVARYVRAFYRP